MGKKPMRRRRDKIQVFQASTGRNFWYWRQRGSNGQIISTSDRYTRRRDAHRAAKVQCERHCAPVGYCLQMLDKTGAVINEEIIDG